MGRILMIIVVWCRLIPLRVPTSILSSHASVQHLCFYLAPGASENRGEDRERSRPGRHYVLQRQPQLPPLIRRGLRLRRAGAAEVGAAPAANRRGAREVLPLLRLPPGEGGAGAASPFRLGCSRRRGSSMRLTPSRPPRRIKCVSRDAAINSLKAHEQELRAAGVVSLSLFGSTARGEASGPTSTWRFAWPRHSPSPVSTTSHASRTSRSVCHRSWAARSTLSKSP